MLTPRISLDQWRALVAVVDAGSYARAAEALHKSQSSVTYAIQQIESQLGLKAFGIEGRKAVLTPTGQMLLRRARYLLDEAAGLEQSAQRLSAGWEAELRIAVEVLFPTWLLFSCLDRFGQESPATRIEMIESVLGHRSDALAPGPGLGRADLAIFGVVPPGFIGEPLLRMRFLLVAHPDHPLHKLGHKPALRDLRPYRHLVVRESSPERASAPSMETAQRWTVSHLASSIEAVRSGYGFAWLPEEKIRDELSAGTLKPLTLREGGERFADLYLIFADREHAGPGALRLAEIIRETTAGECSRRRNMHGTQRGPAPGTTSTTGRSHR
jgi:DNA-binding transcriptional LysR family regulator